MRSIPKATLGKLAHIDRGVSWAASQETREPGPNSVPVLRISNIQQRLELGDLLFLNGVTEKQKQENTASRGSVMMVGSNGNHARIGNCCRIEDDADYLFASFLIGLLPNRDEVDPGYLFHILRSREVQDAISASVTGSTGLANLSLSFLKGLEVFRPGCPEQQAIARFFDILNQATEQTEALLKKQQRIKIGLMHDLLTRGLDAQGRLRDPSTHSFRESSLGLVPKEWEVNALRYYLKFISYGFTNPMPETPDGPFMVTAANINNGRIDFSSCRHTAEDAFRKLLTDKSRPQRNDILLTKDGSLGRLALAGGEAICINQSVAILRVNDRIEAGFLKRLLEAEKYQELMLDDAGGSTIKHLYITRVETLQIAIPQSPEERAQIENIIRAQDLEVDRLRAAEHKLQRLKSGLMHDLLAGTVPVTPLLSTPPNVI